MDRLVRWALFLAGYWRGLAQDEVEPWWGSSGCGKALPPPYTAGQSIENFGDFGGVRRKWLLHVPASYRPDVPAPLVVALHGWTNDSPSYEADSGLSVASELHGFIVVYPEGMDDNPRPRISPDRTWCSWNVAGTSHPGRETCERRTAAIGEGLCYSSCDCNETSRCAWTSCVNDITPTGIGTESVNGFLPTLVDRLAGQMCINLDRLYATGCSNGGMAAYQLGVSLADRLAAIAPVAGSFHKGFLQTPGMPLPLLDVHSFEDEDVPANGSVSSDGWYFTPVQEIMSAWRQANGCAEEHPAPRIQHWPTSLDGLASLYCVSEGSGCIAPTVRCAWSGPHGSFLGGGVANAQLVWEFLSKFAKHEVVASNARRRQASHMAQVHHRPRREGTATRSWVDCVVQELFARAGTLEGGRPLTGTGSPIMAAILVVAGLAASVVGLAARRRSCPASPGAASAEDVLLLEGDDGA